MGLWELSGGVWEPFRVQKLENLAKSHCGEVGILQAMGSWDIGSLVQWLGHGNLHGKVLGSIPGKAFAKSKKMTNFPL